MMVYFQIRADGARSERKAASLIKGQVLTRRGLG